ncbi:MAG: shikimate dehydrogenase [Anaerolineae bacterium]|nr:shikimate dehydrogenase [Anaerolineae bacterium]
MSNAAIRITGKSSLVGLLGWPVKHSLSPLMHNAAFASLGLEWAYVPLPVKPANVEQAMRGLSALGFMGVNVTVPHKQAVIRYLDELNEASQITGAVNTIAIKDGKYLGYNTDSIGFLNSLVEANCHPKSMRVAVLGAGGAARAVVLALANAEAESVTVFNRTAERAAFLVDDLADTFPDSHLRFAPFTSQAIADLKEDVDLVINTTSVGMSPDKSSSPWPDDVAIPKHTVVCDLVYNPLETALLARAKVGGNPTIDGLGMLVHQGAHAFEIWTGQHPPIDIMRAAALSGLGVK